MQNNVGIYASQISGHLYGGPYGAYDSLASVTVGSTSVATISFAGIPTGYKNLQLRVLSRSDAGSSGLSGIQLSFNGDTTSGNYSFHRLVGDGSSASAYGQSGLDYVMTNSNAANTSGMFTTSIVDILDYANASKAKTTRVLTGGDLNNTLGVITLRSQGWFSTSPITSMLLTPSTGSFVQYSSFALYGVK